MRAQQVMAASLRLPNLIVIGVTKAGTSSLFDYLGRHPDVGLSDTKELRFFSPVRHGHPVGSLDDYARHFANLHQRYAVEATPGYFYGGKELAKTMDALCEEPKVILSLREPISRCWSWYQFEKSRLLLPKFMTFEKYLDWCFKLHETAADGEPESQPFWGVGGGCYDTWMDDWIDVYESRLKVVFFNDLTADPAAVMIGLFAWLGLDWRQANLTELFAFNVTEQYKIKAIQQLAVLVNRHGERFFRKYPMVKRTVREGYYKLNREEPKEVMSQEARERLEAFYRPHNDRLAAQLRRIGRELPWAT